MLRLPLALLFLVKSMEIRVAAIICSMLTDCIDGYLARKYKHITRIGAVLDPIMDKLFVFFVLGVLFSEGVLPLWSMIAMLSRDVALAIFALIVTVTKRWQKVVFTSMKWGKVTTFIQFFILLALSLQFTIYPTVYYILFILSFFIFIELLTMIKTDSRKTVSPNID